MLKLWRNSVTLQQQAQMVQALTGKKSILDISRGFNVVILADNDDISLNHATNIAENIIQTACSVKLVPSQALYEPLQPKGDIPTL